MYTDFISSTTRLISTQINLTSDEYAFNSSVVIVWEKCGIIARTEVTEIFKFTHAQNEITLFYNPSINVLVFQTINLLNTTQIKKDNLKLPSVGGEILFFVFNEPGKMHIYLDCPSVSKTKYVMHLDQLTLVEKVRVFVNTKLFRSLEVAMETFKCRSTITISPGTILHFHGHLTLNGNVILISFLFQNIHFSISIESGHVIVTTSSQTIELPLIYPITTNGIYIIFTHVSLQFFVTCPYNQPVAALWSTNMFNQKLMIETSRNHYQGSAASSILLYSFCNTNNILNILSQNQTTCLATSIISENIHIVDNANLVYSQFIPSTNIMEKIDSFNAINTINLGQLVENEPKLLIASRYKAGPRFFYRPLNEYVEGFSDGQFNFWIGLDTLNRVTSAHNFSLRVEATSPAGVTYAEEYLNFKVGDSAERYKLTVSGLYTGTNGYFSRDNSVYFTTYDYGQTQYAQQRAGGWWHGASKYFCLTCEDRVNELGSSTNVYLSQANNVQIYFAKMYLLVRN